jgi:tRNA A-37 threonylcarbamoyl transferase component Bud32
MAKGVLLAPARALRAGLPTNPGAAPPHLAFFPPMSEVVASPVREGDILAAKYRVDRVLGAGGMGVVVAATHLQLDQRVALKFLVDRGIDEQASFRFLREARAVVRLRSENVVRVLDTGSLDNGQPYIVMELLEGRDLAQELSARGPVSVVEAVDWVLQACEGIAEAHAAGIVHRDLKPANLFLTRRADRSVLIKVLDFGIAKVLDLQRAPDYSLTKTATLMGSPHYMSPEQIRNAKSVDQRADIWALGIVLYELLTGSAPFSATTAPALLAQIVADPPRPLRPLRPEVPKALEAVIARCLEKEPARRFADIPELARELSRFASEEGRLSSERVVRIAQAFGPKPAGRPPIPEFGTEATLLAVGPRPGRRSARWAVPLAFGVCGLCVAIGFAVRGERATPVSATSVASSIASTGAPFAVAATPLPAAPVVTPVPGNALAQAEAAATPAPAVTHESDSVAAAAPVPLPLKASSLFRHQTVRSTTNPAVSLPPSLPAPLQRAAEPPPANPLDDRK